MKPFSRTGASILSLLTIVGLTGCSGGGGDGGGSSPTEPPPPNQNVTFEYHAAPSLDPAVDFDTCTAKQVRFKTHLHFTWNDWEDRRNMDAVGDDLFRYTGEVPVGQDLEIALHDPNKCLDGDVYVAPDGLFANGILLVRVVEVDEGTGLAFRVEPNGTVTP